MFINRAVYIEEDQISDGIFDCDAVDFSQNQDQKLGHSSSWEENDGLFRCYRREFVIESAKVCDDKNDFPIGADEDAQLFHRRPRCKCQRQSIQMQFNRSM